MVQDQTRVLQRISPGMRGFPHTLVDRPSPPPAALPPAVLGEDEGGRHRPRARRHVPAGGVAVDDVLREVVPVVDDGVRVHPGQGARGDPVPAVEDQTVRGQNHRGPQAVRGDRLVDDLLGEIGGMVQDQTRLRDGVSPLTLTAIQGFLNNDANRRTYSAIELPRSLDFR